MDPARKRQILAAEQRFGRLQEFSRGLAASDIYLIGPLNLREPETWERRSPVRAIRDLDTDGE